MMQRLIAFLLSAALVAHNVAAFVAPQATLQTQRSTRKFRESPQDYR